MIVDLPIFQNFWLFSLGSIISLIGNDDITVWWCNGEITWRLFQNQHYSKLSKEFENDQNENLVETDSNSEYGMENDHDRSEVSINNEATNLLYSKCLSIGIFLNLVIFTILPIDQRVSTITASLITSAIILLFKKYNEVWISKSRKRDMQILACLLWKFLVKNSCWKII